MKKVAIIFACILFVPFIAFAQQGATITGTVTDEAGNPLPGANVVLEGTPFGAATNADGEYSFVVPAEATLGQDATLMVRFIGYQSSSEQITVRPGTHTQNFSLKVDVLQLESIVVTGMGATQTKEKLGVSIAQVKPELVQSSDEGNVVTALAGKAPGIHVQETSGDPGTNSFIRIRGAASIDRTTQPLFVVDGVPISNRTDYTIGSNGGTESSNRASDINSEDIASIDILKGPAAAAIYGSRASNGVVMITTKSGQVGRTKISYKANFGWTKQSSFYPLQTWFGQGTKGAFRKNYSRSWGAPLNVPGAPHYDPSLPEDAVYDHAREITDVGLSNENNITISGGNRATQFFLSFGRLYEGGHWIAGSDYERYTARVKATQAITSNFKLTGNIAYANVAAHYLQRGDNAVGLMLGTLRTPPEFNNLPYIDPETGFHRSYRYSDATKLRASRRFDNPFFIMHEHENPRDLGRVYGYIKAEYDATDWLKLDYTFGSDYSNDDALYVNPLSGSREGGTGHLRRSNFIYHELDGNFVATINGHKFLQEISPNLSGTFMVGHNLNRREYSRLQSTGIDMGVPGFNQLDNTVSTNLSANEYQWLIHTESFFGQATIDVYDQLYLTGALRNDGSSTFGASEKRHWYPKFSAAWEFTKADFMPVLPYLSFGKVRFAYGESGVQPGVYTTVSGFSSGLKGFGLFTSSELNSTYQGINGYFASSNQGTTNIKPERTKETEFGINLAFWDSRIGLDLTRYNQKSTDVIFDLNLVPSSGSFSQTANAAVIENKGWEASLDLIPLQTKNLTWNLGFIYARNKNMVVTMRDNTGNPLFEQIGRWAYAGEGHELGELRLNSFVRFGYGMTYDVDGDGIEDDIDALYAGQWTKGDVFMPERGDLTGYPVMSGELIWSGLSANPDWTGSIRNEFTIFQNFTVSAFVDFVQGHHIMNHGAGALFSYGTHFGTADRGQIKQIPLTGKYGTGPDGRNDIKGIGPGAGKEVELTESWYRSAGAGFSGDGFQFTEDASYVKLREVSIGYRLRNEWVKGLGLSDVHIRLSGRNIKTWTDYTGFDPDTNRRQATAGRDSDYFNQPQARTYSVTLRVNY